MRGERAQAFLDGLVIADVRQDLLENRQLGLLSRDRQSRLRHQHQQADRLQRYGLSARIGTADQQCAAGGVELERNRHDRLALPPQHIL